MLPKETRPDPPSLRTTVWDRDFPNPLGVCVCVCVGLLIRGCGARSGWVLASCVCSFGRQAVAKNKAAQWGLRRLPGPVISVHHIAFDTYSIGLAAGFDKSAEGPEALLNLGFGFVEIGEYSPKQATTGGCKAAPHV